MHNHIRITMQDSQLTVIHSRAEEGELYQVVAQRPISADEAERFTDRIIRDANVVPGVVAGVRINGVGLTDFWTTLDEDHVPAVALASYLTDLHLN